MLNNILISYDLIKTKDYTKLIDAIKSYGEWAKVLESVWIIKTNSTTEQVINNLIRSIDTDDKIIVLRLTNDGMWYNLPPDVSKWLKDNLK